VWTVWIAAQSAAALVALLAVWALISAIVVTHLHKHGHGHRR